MQGLKGEGESGVDIRVGWLGARCSSCGHRPRAESLRYSLKNDEHSFRTLKSGHPRVGSSREKVETSPETRSNRLNGSFCIKQTEIREERLDSTDGHPRDEFGDNEKEAGRELIV